MFIKNDLWRCFKSLHKIFLFVISNCCCFLVKIQMSTISDGTSPFTVNPTDALVLPTVFYPIFEQLNQSGYETILTDIRTTLFKLEEIYPGFSRDFLQILLAKHLPNSSSTVNLNQLILQLEKSCDKSSYYLSPTLTRQEKDFHELNVRSKTLKHILSRIPDDINEKREFLETIKEIASAIKKTLDCLPNLYQYLKTLEARQTLENEKKEFIKSSKHFSNTLKAYFRDNKRDDVYLAANSLLLQTDYLLRAIKLHCEPTTIDPCAYPLLNQHQNQIKLSLFSRHSALSQRQSSTNRTSYENN